MAASFPIRWRDAVYSTTMTSRAKSVAGAVSIHMDGSGGSIWPSLNLLCAETSMSRKTVIAGLAELSEWGFLEVVRPGGGRRKTTHYRGRIPELTVEQLHRFARERVESESKTVEFLPVNDGAAPPEDVQEGVQEGGWLTKVIEETA